MPLKDVHRTMESAGLGLVMWATEYRWARHCELARWPRMREAYHRAVQNLVLGAISGVAVILVVLGTVTMLSRRGRITSLQVVVGIGVGLLGAALVLITRTDLIPDVPQDFLERVAIIAVTIAAVIGTWYRIARA